MLPVAQTRVILVSSASQKFMSNPVSFTFKICPKSNTPPTFLAAPLVQAASTSYLEDVIDAYLVSLFTPLLPAHQQGTSLRWLPPHSKPKPSSPA